MPNPRIKFDLVAIDKTRAGFRSVRQRAISMQKTIRGLQIGGAALISGFGLGVLVRRTNEENEALRQMALRLGTTTQFLSEMRFVTAQTGVTFDAFTMGLQRMVRRVSQAAQGAGEAKDAIKELGLDAQFLNELRPDQQFLLMAEALLRVERQGDRVRIAQKVWDSEGVKLLQTVQGGAKAIINMARQSRELGRTLTEDGAKKSGEYARALIRKREAFRSLADTISRKATPAMTRYNETMANALDRINRFISGRGKPKEKADPLAEFPAMQTALATFRSSRFNPANLPAPSGAIERHQEKTNRILKNIEVLQRNGRDIPFAE